jgi:hypothetical protein
MKSNVKGIIKELKEHCYQEKYLAENKLAFQSVLVTLEALLLLYIANPFVTNHYKPIWYVLRGFSN